MKKIILAVVLFAITISIQAQQVNYQEESDDFANPERGFYYAISTKPDGFAGAYRSLSSTAAQGDLQDAIDHNISLIQFIVRLDQYKTTNVIPSTFLSNINSDFGQLRAKGLKCILRFSYSNYYGDDVAYPDPIPGNLNPSNVYEASLDRMLGVPRTSPAATMPGHINQLRAITMANEDVISSMEAGFIGDFGEWYYSKTTSPASDFGLGDPFTLDAQTPTTTFKNNRAEVAAAIMTMTPNRMVAFRTPYFQRLLAPNLNAGKTPPFYNGSVFSRVAAHNDAFAHDRLDDGTYRDISGDLGAADRSYLATKSNHTFTGGESNSKNEDYATCDPNTTANPLGKSSIEQMEDYNYNYLNYSYFEELMDPDTGYWATNGCLDEIKNRMGYRFVLQFSNIASDKLTVRLRNNGFANVFNARNVYLVLQNGSLIYKVAIWGPIDSNEPPAPTAITNIRGWNAGGSNLTLTRNLVGMTTAVASTTVGAGVAVPYGTYQLYLEIPDGNASLVNDPRYSIRLANSDDYTVGTTAHTGDFWDEGRGFNNLFKSVTISAAGASKAATGDALTFDVITSPNPFTDNFRLRIITSSEEKVSIKAYDMLGKLVEDTTVNASDLESLEIGSALSTGIYNIVVRQGENEKTVRVVKK